MMEGEEFGKLHVKIENFFSFIFAQIISGDGRKQVIIRSNGAGKT